MPHSRICRFYVRQFLAAHPGSRLRVRYFFRCFPDMHVTVNWCTAASRRRANLPVILFVQDKHQTHLIDGIVLTKFDTIDDKVCEGGGG